MVSALHASRTKCPHACHVDTLEKAQDAAALETVCMLVCRSSLCHAPQQSIPTPLQNHQRHLAEFHGGSASSLNSF